MKIIVSILLLLFSFFLSACSAFKGDRCKSDLKNVKCVKYAGNFDGDTVTFKVPGGHLFYGKEFALRLADIDCPEIRGKCKKEKETAAKAQEYVKTVLEAANDIDIVNVHNDQYFRISGKVIYDGKSLNDELLKEKLAVPMQGTAKYNWCK